MNATLCQRLVKKWGITKKFNLASWILPDGSLVGGYGNPSHEEMILRLFTRKNSMIFSEFIDATKCIRCLITNSNELDLTINGSFTPEQEHIISIWPKVNRILVDLVVLDENGEHYKHL